MIDVPLKVTTGWVVLDPPPTSAATGFWHQQHHLLFSIRVP